MNKVLRNLFRTATLAILTIICVLNSNAQTPMYFKAGTGTSGNTIPWNQTSQKTQILYIPTEFSSLPISGDITKIYFRNSAAASTGTFTDLKISFLQNNNTAFPSTSFYTGLTQVLFTTSLTVTGNAAAGGWFEIALPPPYFQYDNTKSLIVEIQYTAKTNGLSTITTASTTGNKRCSGTSLTATTGTTNTTQNDFGMDVVPSAPCTTPPTAGTTVSTASSICAGSNFTLNLTGSSIGSGLTYQWQKSADNIIWADEPSAVNSSYTTSQTSTNYYRCKVTCSGSTDSSVSVMVNNIPPLNGTYTIDNTLPTGPTNFISFADAIAAMNCGIAGPVTFEVASGQTFTEAALSVSVTGTASNPVVFKKSGTLANPKIYRLGTSATSDYGVQLLGVDYVTFDGIDIEQTGTITANYVEYGYYLNAASATNGAQFNTIKNCNITLRDTISSRGIKSAVSSPSAVSGTNSNNIYLNNITNNCYYGYDLIGGSSNLDDNNIIDGDTIGKSIVENITAYGSACYPINFSYQTNFKIKNTIIRNVNAATGSTIAIYGIHNNTGAGNTVELYNNRIYNINGKGTTRAIYSSVGALAVIHGNEIHDITTSATTNAFGIYVTVAASGRDSIFNNKVYNIICTNTVDGEAHGITVTTGLRHVIYNNIIHSIKSPNSAYTSPVVKGLSLEGTTTNSVYKVYHNTIFIDDTAVNTGHTSTALFLSSSANPIYDLRNNIFVNKTLLGPGTRVAAITKASAGFANIAATSNNNLYYAGTPSTTNVIMYDGTSSYQTINDYQTLVNPSEANATTEDLNIVEYANGELRVDLNMATRIESGGSLITGYATADFENTARGPYPLAGQKPDGGMSPDIGADENDYTKYIPPVPPNCATIVAPFSGAINICPSNLVIKWSPDPFGPIATHGFDFYFGTTSNPPFIGNLTTTTYEPSTLLGNTKYYWKVVPKNNVGGAINCLVDSFITSNISVTSSTGATICGLGTLNLSATGNSDVVLWYNDANAGKLLHAGNNYTTPTLSQTTTYYAGAADTSKNFVGNINRVGTTNSTTSNAGLVFNATTDLIIDSIFVYPIGTGVGTVKFMLRDANGNSLDSTTATLTGIATPGVKTKVALGFYVKKGDGYRLSVVQRTGLVANLAYENTAANAGLPKTSSGNEITITGSYTGTGSPVLTSYYFLYDWRFTSLCQSVRTPVTATVTPADTIVINALATSFCDTASVALTATSANTNYTYTWSPASGLSATTGATVTANIGTTKTYTVIGTDGICTNTKTITIQINDTTIAGVINGSNQLCLGDTTVLNLTGHRGTIQWQKFNGTWMDIAGETNASLEQAPAQTTQYRAVIQNGICASKTTLPITVTVTNALITSTNGTIEKCGPGNVNFIAASASGTVKWYSAMTGGNPIHTGDTFATFLNDTATYYADPSTGMNNQPAGILNRTSTSGYSLEAGLRFNTNKNITIKSVQVYPTGTGKGKIIISLRNSAGTVLATMSDSLMATTSPGVKTTLNLNFYVPAGTGYRLMLDDISGGITELIRESGIGGYPYVSADGTVRIDTGILTASPSTSYYFFYDWKYSYGCPGARVAVTANVSPSTSITAITSLDTICQGDSATLSVSSANANYVYTWSPATGLNTTTGASVKASPSVNTTYIVTSVDNLNCTNIDTVKIVVTPATIAGTASIFTTGCSTLSIADSMQLKNYSGSIQWQRFNGTTWVDETGPGNTNAKYGVLTTGPTTFRAKVTKGSCTFYSNSITTTILTSPSTNVMVGASQQYTSLTGAGGLFDAINCSGLTGNTIVTITSDLLETGERQLLDKNNGFSLTIQSDGTPRLVSGKSVNGLIVLNGADSVTVDGGINKNLTFRNDTNSSAIVFMNDASYNTVTNSIVEAGGTNSNVIFFGSTNGTTGNDENTISNCDIRSTPTKTPLHGILALGNTTNTSLFNSNNKILNNKIYDFYQDGGSAINGVNINTGNTNWTVSGNHFYQTQTRTTTVATIYQAIRVNELNGNGFIITDNYIGGNAPNTAGRWITKGTGSQNTVFYPIRLNVGKTIATEVTNNTIANIEIESSPSASVSVFVGMLVDSGKVNIISNKIGSDTTTTTNSINMKLAGTISATFTGISYNIRYGGDIRKNTIGGILLDGTNTSTGSSFNGISLGNAVISNFKVDSNKIVNIKSSNLGAHLGITSTVIVPAVGELTNNIISDIRAIGTGTSSRVGGINHTGAGRLRVAGNTIFNLSSVTTSTTSTTASVTGIYVSSSDTLHMIENNKIYQLKNTPATITANTWVIGIVLNTSTAKGFARNNTIYGLENTSKGTTANITGIHMFNGKWIGYNNMIALSNGSNTNPMIIRGIYDNGSTTASWTAVNNTVHISGHADSAAQPSYAFQRNVATPNYQRNNIYVNTRTSVSGNHYAIANTVTTSTANGWDKTVSNNNVLYTADTALARWGSTDIADIAAWRTIQGGGAGADSLSINYLPNFISQTDLRLQSNNCDMSDAGVQISYVTHDIDNVLRNNPPDIGAAEFTAPFTPVINASGPLTVCSNATLILSANPSTSGYTYEWYKDGVLMGGQSDDTLIVSTAGEYYAKISNSGCSLKSNKMVVTVVPSPVVSLGVDTSICLGTVLTLDAGNAGSTYLWSDGTSAQTMNVTTAGIYYVDVTNSQGCSSRDSVTVGVNPVPVLDFGADKTSCVGNAVILDAGNPGATYLWSTGETTQTITVNTTGNYHVTVTNSSNCSKSDTVLVTFQSTIVDLGADAEICTSNPKTLDAGNTGSTYLWSTGETTQTIQVSLAGTYSVIVTGTNGCEGRDTIVITNKPAPNAAFNFTTNNLQASFTVPAQTGVAYNWNFGSGGTSTQPNPTHAYTTAGTYTVTLTVTNIATGCSSTTTQQVTVTVGTGVGATKNDFELKAYPNPFSDKTTIDFELNKTSEVLLEIYDVVGKRVAVLIDREQLNGKQSYVWNIENNNTGMYYVRLTVDGKTSIIRLSNVR